MIACLYYCSLFIEEKSCHKNSENKISEELILFLSPKLIQCESKQQHKGETRSMINISQKSNTNKMRTCFVAERND